MKTLTIDHKNGNETIYQLIQDGDDLPIAYNSKTSIEVINAIEYARETRKRVQIYLGDHSTGKNWNEENYTKGYIGLSRGKEARFPLLVHNSRSLGGGSLMDDSIIKIKETKTGRVLYQSSNFKQSKFEIVESDMMPEYKFNLLIDGSFYSRHKTERGAKLLLNKLS